MNKQNIIPIEEIQFSPNSVCDKIGRVFTYQGKIYRIINDDYREYTLDLLQSEMFAMLVEKGFFPNTVIADIEVENHSLIIEHAFVQPSQPAEWSFSMLKQAALLLLELNDLLQQYGYKLYDGHFYNVFFDKNHPIFIDFGSIILIDSPSCFNEEFINITAYPLILAAMGEGYISKALLTNSSTIYQRTIPSQGIVDSSTINRTIKQFFSSLSLENWFAPIIELRTKLLDRTFLNKNIINTNFNETMWGAYQDDFFIAIDEAKVHERFDRFNKISEYINYYCNEAQSVIDLAGNQGAMLYFLERKYPNYTNLINVDYDEIAIEQSRVNLIKRKSIVQSYLMNFMLHKRELKNDFKCDVVLALAITHHLLLSQGFYIDVVFDKIKIFSKKYVFIEFMPWGLWGGGEKPPVPEWYTEEWFEKNFKRHFNLIYKEDFGHNRILFIGQLLQ